MKRESEADRKIIRETFEGVASRIKGLEESMVTTNKTISDVDQSLKATTRGFHEISDYYSWARLGHGEADGAAGRVDERMLQQEILWTVR